MTISLGDALEAFIQEHEYCGELDAAVEENRVWMSCTCGAVIVRLLEPAARARAVGDGGFMAITFKVDSTTGEGTFIRVLRDGRPFGKILDAVGLYRFYEDDHERLGGSAELQDADLERLKTAIQWRYEGR
jgi:hypothetical protein